MYHLILSLFSIYLMIPCAKEESVQLLLNAKTWGPGLEPHKFTLPARYFFIEFFHENIKINKSLESPLEFVVDAKALNQERKCRLMTNILDRKDGTYILRYKLFEQCTIEQINVKYNNAHITGSPFVINQNANPEKCMCPERDLVTWLEKTECGEVPTQILTDLKHFKTVNWNDIREKVIKKFNNPGAVSLCHYIVKNNDIYRKCYGKYVGFNMFMDAILLSLARKMRIPDIELFVNLGDWPLTRKESVYPIFSWCGSTDSFDIVMPTYDVTESTIENMGRVMLDVLSVQGNTDHLWEHRKPQAFWRGRDSNIHRLTLIDTSRKHPELFNASLTNFFFYRDLQDKYGPKSDHVSLYKFFDYKYQVSIDGTVASYRLPYLLSGGSLIFKQASKYYEHFYNDLTPEVHYIPIKEDLSDLVKKIEWAMKNDEKAKEIAQNGQKFANDRLLPKNIYCYHAHLLNQFSKIITSKIEIEDEMEKVEQPSEATKCDCKNAIKDEL